MTSSFPDVFEYVDYRTWLKDCHRARREARPGWSYHTWAKRVGLRSASTLVMIVGGQRNPSPRVVDALSRWGQLDPERSGYLHALVDLERRRKDPRAVAEILERIDTFGRRRPRGFQFLDHQKFSAVARWYYYAIREMTVMPAFQEDPHWIRSHLRFPVTIADVRAALNTLLSLGLLTRNERGRLQPGSAHLETSSETASAAIQQFHQEALTNAKVAIDTLPPERRELRGVTFALPRSRLPEARELLRKFQNDFCDLLEAGPADAVYHLEMAFYPVAECRQAIGGSDAK